MTDSNTDIGKVIVDGGFGWWCECGDEREFKLVNKISGAELEKFSVRPFVFLKGNYDVIEEYKLLQI